MSFRNNKSVNSVEEILNCINEYCENNSIVKDTKIKPLSEFEINNLPKLPKDWKWVISNDISTFITNGVHSPTSSEDKLGINKKMLRITDLKDNVEPDFEDLPYCKRFVKGDYDKNIKKNDIYISFTGNILGKRYIVKETREDVVFAHYFVRWQPIVVNPYYIYYVLLSDHFDRFMYENTLGSTQPNLKVTALKRVPLPLAPLDEQNRIATFFNNIDMKIQVNNQINKTLENMAQTIFKQWFVDFEFPNDDGEPYKSSGGEMIESELGMIPKGWEVKDLGEIIDIHDSKRIPLSKNEREKREKIYPYYGAASLMDYVDEFIFDGIYVLLGEDGTVVNEDGSPVLQYVWGKFWVNNHAHVLSGKKGVSTNFLYILLSNLNVLGAITGAVQLKINQKNLKEMKIIMPNDMKLVSQFSDIVDKSFEKIRVKRDESNNLVSLRDSLLPKLMSGEIRVPLDEEGDVS